MIGAPLSILSKTWPPLEPEICEWRVKKLVFRSCHLSQITQGIVGSGLGKLLESKQVKKMIASHVGENKVLESM